MAAIYIQKLFCHLRVENKGRFRIYSVFSSQKNLDTLQDASSVIIAPRDIRMQLLLCFTLDET
jgi:hypothetical protein